MSQLNAFMDGLGAARQQTDRDAQTAMDMETRRAAIQESMLQNARADERLQLDRDRAIREGRDSDFAHQERKDKAAREVQLRDGYKSIIAKYTAPKEVVGPDGKKSMVAPDLGDLKTQQGLLTDVFMHQANSGIIDPAAIKQMREYGDAAKKEGWMDALAQAMAGDGSGIAKLLPNYGLDPKSVKLDRQVDPQTKMTTSRLVGAGPDGKPFSMDLTPLLIAKGLSEYDIDKPANDRARAGSQINASNASANASNASAYASRRNADSLDSLRGAQVRAIDEGRPTTAAGARASNRTGDGGLVPDLKYDNAFRSGVTAHKPQLPENIRKQIPGMQAGMEDQEGREIIRDEGYRIYGGNQKLSPGQLISEADKVLQGYNRKTADLLPQTGFLKDKETGEIKAVKAGTPGSVPFGKLLGPNEKIAAFKATRRYVVDKFRQRRDALDSQSNDDTE